MSKWVGFFKCLNVHSFKVMHQKHEKDSTNVYLSMSVGWNGEETIVSHLGFPHSYVTSKSQLLSQKQILDIRLRCFNNSFNSIKRNNAETPTSKGNVILSNSLLPHDKKKNSLAYTTALTEEGIYVSLSVPLTVAV